MHRPRSRRRERNLHSDVRRAETYTATRREKWGPQCVRACFTGPLLEVAIFAAQKRGKLPPESRDAGGRGSSSSCASQRIKLRTLDEPLRISFSPRRNDRLVRQSARNARLNVMVEIRASRVPSQEPCIHRQICSQFSQTPRRLRVAWRNARALQIRRSYARFWRRPPRRRRYPAPIGALYRGPSGERFSLDRQVALEVRPR